MSGCRRTVTDYEAAAVRCAGRDMWQCHGRTGDRNTEVRGVQDAGNGSICKAGRRNENLSYG